jgi:surface antigen
MRKFLKSFLLSILIISSFGGVAHAEEAPRPLAENDQIILQQSQQVEQKATVLQNTSQEIQTLELKKQSLSDQLKTEQKTIEDLKQKIADKKAAAEAEQKRLDEIKNMFVHINRYADGSAGNLYTPGNCTWYVKNRRPDLPNNLGNADTWFYRAQAQGWNVGYTAKKGAAAQTKAGMHVVYIEGVSLDGSTVTLSEMNVRGLYSMNTRTAPASDFLYIYELN